MKYEKPLLREVRVDVRANTNASNLSSCDGGHCVKAKWSADPKV